MTTFDFASASSDELEVTTVEVGRSPRAFYLQNAPQCPPPLIAYSEFVPKVMIDHLMRNKKDCALAVKYVQHNTPNDKITNMEGALHTYVTPVLLVKIHGDYRFNGKHEMLRFSNGVGFQQARLVVLSAAVQPDFEDHQVMLAVSALGEEEFVGRALPSDFCILDSESKQDQYQRAGYDERLRSHMVTNLVRDSRLPPLSDVLAGVKTIEDCCRLLEKLIRETVPEAAEVSVRSLFVRLLGGSVASLELLCNSAFHQARNEVAALESLCPQGYVYTSDPPSIFAREIGSMLLNRIQILALKRLASTQSLTNMRVFAFNDYADKEAIPLLQEALESRAVRVIPKAELFGGEGGGYLPQAGAEKALLVIHNNSDAFGQNVETEHESGSLDGAIGANSSAAASLLRDREDLTQHRLVV